MLATLVHDLMKAIAGYHDPVSGSGRKYRVACVGRPVRVSKRRLQTIADIKKVYAPDLDTPNAHRLIETPK
jgi:flagellar motor switch protein FliM